MNTSLVDQLQALRDEYSQRIDAIDKLLGFERRSSADAPPPFHPAGTTSIGRGPRRSGRRRIHQDASQVSAEKIRGRRARKAHAVDEPSPKPHSTTRPSASPPKRPTIKTRVLEAVTALGRPFSRVDVRDWLEKHYEDEVQAYGNSMIDGALHAMRETGELVVSGEVKGLFGPLKLHTLPK